MTERFQKRNHGITAAQISDNPDQYFGKKVINYSGTEAAETLEKADEPLGEEETQKVNASLTVAFDYLTQVNNQSDVQVTYKDKLSITSQAMAQTVVTMLKAGYQLDITTLKVYASDSENVYQFTVDLTKDGAENLSLAGNYVTGTQQLEIASLHGIPTGIQY